MGVECMYVVSLQSVHCHLSFNLFVSVSRYNKEKYIEYNDELVLLFLKMIHLYMHVSCFEDSVMRTKE